MKHREVCRKDLWEYEAWSNHVRNTVSLGKKSGVRITDVALNPHREDAPHYTVQYDLN